MNGSARFPILILTLALLTPFALGHSGLTGQGGVSKDYCETSDRHVHDYSAGGSGAHLSPAVDGVLDDCDGNGLADDADGHYEFTFGGAYLLACETACGLSGMGGGSSDCWGTSADHPSFGPIHVEDVILGSATIFWVSVDNVDLSGLDAPCGDGVMDATSTCVTSCTVTFGPGLDGAYNVFVEGSAGHVYTDEYLDGGFSTGAGAPLGVAGHFHACPHGVADILGLVP